MTPTLPPPPGCNVELAEKVLTAFLREEAGKFGIKGAVLGLSGGIDSALVLELAARSLGPENVLAVAMPYQTSNPISLELAEKAAKSAGTPIEVVDISKMADAHIQAAGIEDEDSPAARLRKGNIMARARMVILYDRSARDGSLVFGTSNKTELLLGYGTIHGDMASAINPIGDLYKSQVFALSRHLGVPQEIVDRPPSADLWEGQTDEEELGFSYEEVDSLLHLQVDRRYSFDHLLEAGFQKSFIEAISKRVRNNQYKRRPPVIAKLANRTINLDYRYARDWGA
ncbi:MAG TPA: NAD+ synthase [Planctomycetota bacterium]|jgi:NAD+ synthase|nr:NAD(+) synthetase [Planctomycetota bacterium]MDP7246252.1 NAD+ synthase [Planctomycetota bacterium]MDP7559105.1 NAD+ synthase [Planctomycetota bacterium]HJM38509.1 NAD+ synthase [Planctomycetota bacterium]|tara:strand:- start:418 stop:1272 length:855 start_codon:yes stop_codon:yes gene_type:complete